MPVLSGAVLVATSLKLGEESALVTLLDLAVSSCSPFLASASFHSPFSFSRWSDQLLVALVLVTEIDFRFSTLKKSLFSHSSGLGSMLLMASETTATVFTSLPT